MSPRRQAEHDPHGNEHGGKSNRRSDIDLRTQTGQPFDDLGVTYFDRRDAERIRRQLTRRLEALGYTVTLAPRAA